jgi:hypothetical protein
MSQTLPGISDETKETIEDHVKKGKARKFFLISKGANITALEVFKKGPFGPRIMKAKKDGLKGEVTYGVVTGAGKELYFQLAGNEAVAEVMKVDSFTEEPPTKRAKLREFLSDNGLTFKCNYYIITDAASAPDPDGESAPGPPPASALALGDDEADDSPSAMLGQEQEVPVAPPDPAAPPSDTNLFAERLKALRPEIDRVVAAGGPLADEVKLRVSEAGMFARKKDFDQANGILDKVEELLKKASSVPPVPPPPPGDDLSGLFNKRLAEIIPRVKEAAGSPRGETAKLKVSEAGVFGRKKDFIRAHALLDQAEEALNESDGKAGAGEVDLSARFTERLKALLPEVKEAAGTPGGDEAKLKVSEAAVFARKKEFEQANALLDDAEEALKGESPSDLPPSGIVAKRKFLLERWQRVPPEIHADLEKLRAAIEREEPDEDADLLIDLSEDYLNDFFDDMKEAIDSDINSGDAQYKGAVKTIQAFRKSIASEPLIQHLQANDLAPVSVESILLDALAEVEQALAS